MSTLDQILSDEPVETIEADIAPQPEAEQPDGQARDEQGRFAAKGDEGSAPPAPVEEQPPLDHPALLAERRRRQALEQELKQFQLAQQQAPQEMPSIWDDEQGWQQQFQNQTVTQAVQQATFKARVDMSEMLARQANPDFETLKAEYLALEAQNPALIPQVMNDPHPWNKAVQIVKNHKAMQELGATDLASLEAKLTEKIRAELAAQQPAPQQPQFPQSLAGTQSARQSAAAPPAPLTLDQILKT